MHPMNLLIAETGADWTHWSATQHLVGPAMLVLAQQCDEPLDAFRARIRARTARLKAQTLDSVVLLRRSAGSELTAEALLQDLALPPRDVRSLPVAPAPLADIAPLHMLPARATSASRAA
jgi:hypothetical protein